MTSDHDIRFREGRRKGGNCQFWKKGRYIESGRPGEGGGEGSGEVVVDTLINLGNI